MILHIFPFVADGRKIAGVEWRCHPFLAIAKIRKDIFPIYERGVRGGFKPHARLRKPWRPAPHFFGKKVLLICGRAFSLDHRGWKAAPEKNEPDLLGRRRRVDSDLVLLPLDG
jgi:hypothetical protein